MIPLRDDIPTTTTPFVTAGLIALNVVAFLFELSVGQEGFRYIVYAAGLVPAELTTLTDLRPPNIVPVPLTVLSSMFLHGGWMHLIGNMLYLWIFGNNVEDAMGHVRFLIFYILAGIAAAAAQVALNPASTVPMVGASGAIAGVLGAYLLTFPHARVLTAITLLIFIRLVYIPAVVLLGFWFLFQILSATGAGGQEAGVAWYAHIGGFIAGVVLVKPFAKYGARARATSPRWRRWA